MTRFARRFFRRWTSPLGLVVFALVTGMALSAPHVFPEDPFTMVTRPLLWPGENRSYLLGSDMLGRDLGSGAVQRSERFSRARFDEPGLDLFRRET